MKKFADSCTSVVLCKLSCLVVRAGFGGEVGECWSETPSLTLYPRLPEPRMSRDWAVLHQGPLVLTSQLPAFLVSPLFDL